MARVRFLDQVPVGAYTVDGDGNVISASYAVSSSYSLTASYAMNGGGGGGTPGGSNTQIQYNSGSAFGGVPTLTYSASVVYASNIQATGSFSGSLIGTSSYASNSNLLDGKDSTAFATTGSNTFIGNQTISGSQYLSGSIVFNNGTQITTNLYNSGDVELVSNNTQSFVWVDNNGAYINTDKGANNFQWRFWNDGTLTTPGNVTVNGAVSASSFTGSLRGTASYASASVSASYASSSTSASYAFNSTSASYASSSTSASYALSASQTLTASYLNNLSQNLNVSGNVNITGNLTVIGTASFVYTTQSIVVVGASTILLNTNNPAVRFGGIDVVDSGSFGNSSSGSLLWDSQNNKWIYSNPSGSNYDSGMLISGPRNSAGLGNEVGLNEFFVAVSQGSDHITSSQIYTSGSITQVTGSLFVTAGITGSFTGSLIGSASYASQSLSASYALSSTSASYASSSTSASYALNSTSASYASSSTSASYAFSSTSASYALFSTSASYASGSTSASYASSSTSASYAFSSTSASYASSSTSASYASSSTSASYASSSTSASYAFSSTSASYASSSTSASYASSSTSASYTLNATSASFLPVGTYGITSSWATTASYALVSTGGGGGGGTAYQTGPTAVGITEIVSYTTGSSHSAFSNYVIYSGSNSRAGQFITVWNGVTASYTDVSTLDIGNTSTIVFTSSISTNLLKITANTSISWSISMSVTFV